MAHHRFFIDGVEHLDLRWRFRAVVMAFGFAFLCYIVWSATDQAAVEKNHQKDRAISLASLMAARLDDHVVQIDRLLAVAAQAVGNGVDNVGAVDALLQGMQTFVPASTNDVAVWGVDGGYVASIARTTGARSPSIADQSYFRDAIKSRGLVFEAPIISRPTGEVIAVFARPIVDRVGQVVGVITLSSRLRRLIADLDSDHRVTEDTLVAVVDRRGYIVARSIEPALFVGTQLPDTSKLGAAFAAKRGARDITHADGQVRMTGFATATLGPWIVYAGEPLEVAIAPVSERLLRNLGLGLVILCFAMVLAGRVASWTIDPLLRLAADTERLGAGDLAHRSSVVTGAEIATLAANFNRMAATLEEREQALATSQRQIREIANHMPAKVTFIDRDERYRFVNRHIGRMSIAPADMLGKTVLEVRGEEIYDKLKPSMDRALAGNACVLELTSEFEGRPVHLRTDYVPARDPSGEVVGVYAFTQDVTERKTAELQLAESEKRLALITDNLPAMVCYVDAHRVFQFANRAMGESFGKASSEVVGRTFSELMPPSLSIQYEHYFQRGMKGETLHYEVEAPQKSGNSTWVRATFIPDVDEHSGRVQGVYGMLHDITTAKEAEQRLTRLAQFDSLTGLPNRHHFNEKLAAALVEADHSGESLALMFLDIDHFKQVNDRYGHGGGDALLKEFAQRLSECVRPTDAVARLAGDEFVILTEGLHSDDEPQFIARKILATVDKPFRIDDSFLQVTSSIGIAMRVFETDASMLMKRADEALYEAKRAGRNTFRLAS